MIMAHILGGQILCRFIGDFFDSGLCSNLMVKCIRCVYGSNLWNMFTGRVYGYYFGTHFMRSYFMLILGVVCFGLSFQSNIWIDYTCYVYGLSLWDRFRGGVCDSSVGAEFTDQVYESSLLVIFSG